MRGEGGRREREGKKEGRKMVGLLGFMAYQPLLVI